MMKKRRWMMVCAVLMGTLVVTGAAAQSNERIDELLGQNPATRGHAAYLVLTASGALPESTSVQAAHQAAVDNGYLPSGSAPGDPVTFGQLSFLLMEAFGEPGGVMYRAFPGPRYASREVVYRRWARLRRPPGQIIDGDVAVRVVSVYLNSAAAAGGTR